MDTLGQIDANSFPFYYCTICFKFLPNMLGVLTEISTHSCGRCPFSRVLFLKVEIMTNVEKNTCATASEIILAVSSHVMFSQDVDIYMIGPLKEQFLRCHPLSR